MKQELETERGIFDFSLREFWRQNRFSYLMLLPAFIVVALVIIYPFFYNFNLAFQELNMRSFRSFIDHGTSALDNVGFKYFAEILTQSKFWSVFLMTIIWTVSNVVCHVGFGVFFAILFDRDLRFKSIYRTLMVLPWAIPIPIVVLTWRGMFNYRYGAVNLFLNKLGLPSVSWLTEVPTGLASCIIANVWLGVPFMMMIAIGGLRSIDPNFYEAAEIDGASNWQQIKHITLPLIKPVMTPAVVLGVVWTFNRLEVIVLMVGDTLMGKVEILVSYVYRAAFSYYRYGYAAAFSLIIFGILLIWSISFMEYIREGQRGA